MRAEEHDSDYTERENWDYFFCHFLRVSAFNKPVLDYLPIRFFEFMKASGLADVTTKQPEF
jgi:hypothetical protein